MNCQICHQIPCICGTGWIGFRCGTCFQTPCVCAWNRGVTVTTDWSKLFADKDLSEKDIARIVQAVKDALRPDAHKDEIEALKKERDATRQELADLRRCLKTLLEGK